MSHDQSSGQGGEFEHIRKLSQRSAPYLQTVVTEFTLMRAGAGLEMRLAIDDDPLTIVDFRGKRELETFARRDGVAPRDKLQLKLDALREDPDLMGYRVDCSGWPMRYANGGVLPIVHYEGEDYFLLFYRDIFPIGWNIANGASDDLEEWLAPDAIIHREFGEEVLITDPDRKLLYVYSPPRASGPVDFHRQAVSAWLPYRPELATFRREPMPFKWIEGPDAIEVSCHGRTSRCQGLFLSATPDDHGIEVDRFVMMRLPRQAQLLSGEISNGRPLNHIVGLFHVDRLESTCAGVDFRPDLLFFEGQLYGGDRLEADVLPRYLSYVWADPGGGLGPLHSPEQRAVYEAADVRFNFCPITRALIGRYYAWRARGGAAVAQPAAIERSDRPPSKLAADEHHGTGRHDLFLSHASAQVDVARQLYEYLHAQYSQTPIFLSTQTLREQGESNYRRSIERALETARCLVVLLLDPEDLASEWVNYEWTAFHNEMISGRKPGGQLFVMMNHERLSIADLPFGLRQREVISFTRHSAYDAFGQLSERLAPTLGRGPTGG